jgi:hypothetical protein
MLHQRHFHFGSFNLSAGCQAQAARALTRLILSIMATCVAFWLLFFVVGLPLFPNLYPEGAIPTGLAWYVHVVS